MPLDVSQRLRLSRDPEARPQALSYDTNSSLWCRRAATRRRRRWGKRPRAGGNRQVEKLRLIPTRPTPTDPLTRRSFLPYHAQRLIPTSRYSLLAFSKVARDYNYTRPKITKSKLVEVKEARHPLLECWTTFVPNDIRSGDGSSLIKVLTGPNCCGKSVYLKQIGLVIFMAHIGSYVSAKSAVVGTVSHIFAQISATESVGLHASSFLQNLRQINVALRSSTPTSVVITDELDRGTSEISGLSLVAAVLNTFAERGNECPHVFAATHARPALALLDQTPLIEIQTFEYVVNENESLTFLHRLTNGSTTRSFAHFIARTADVDENLVKRGLEVLEKMKQGDLPSSIHRRAESLRRIIQLSRTPGDFDLEEMKSLVRDAMEPN